MKITKSQLRKIIREEKQKLIAENRVRNAVRAALNEQAGFSSRSLRWITDEVLPPMAQWAEYGLDTSYPLVRAANALKVNVRTGDELALIDTEGDTDADYEMLVGMDLPVIKQMERQMSSENSIQPLNFDSINNDDLKISKQKSYFGFNKDPGLFHIYR